MFDAVAPRYDLLNRLLSARQDQRWRRHLVRRVPKAPGGVYLDVATGTGDVLLAVHAARHEYAAFTGVDISAEMLRRAEAKRAVTAPGDARIHFVKGSAERLDAADGTVDCISIAFGLRNVVDKPKALAEFARVLKSGGRLLILEFFLPRRGPLAWLFQLYFHGILPRIGALLSDPAAYRYLPESVGSFYDGDGLRAELARQGLVETEVKSFLFGACRLVSAVKKA